MSASRITFWWLVVVAVKYLLLTLASQWAWSGDYSYINNLFLAPVIAATLGFTSYAITRQTGLSLINAVSSGYSDKQYTVTTFDGEVERGLFGDKVRITPKQHVTDDRSENVAAMLFFTFVFDSVVVYFGWIQTYLPFLQVFQAAPPLAF